MHMVSELTDRRSIPSGSRFGTKDFKSCCIRRKKAWAWITICCYILSTENEMYKGMKKIEVPLVSI